MGVEIVGFVGRAIGLCLLYYSSTRLYTHYRTAYLIRKFERYYNDRNQRGNL